VSGWKERLDAGPAVVHEQPAKGPSIEPIPSTVEIAASIGSKAVEEAPPWLIKVSSREERLDAERAVIQTRVANFRAHQERFQREREGYFAATMAKVRANQWISDAVAGLGAGNEIAETT
jgi:hypothetical protein